MQTIEELQFVYEAGQVEECLNALQPILQCNPRGRNELLLKAKCELQLLQQATANKTFYADYFTALNDTTERIVTYHKDDDEALSFYVYTQVFFLKTDLIHAVGCCKRLVASDDADMRLKGVYYRYEAYKAMGDVENALSELEMLIIFTQRHYQHDLAALNIAQAKNYIRKGDIYRLLKHDTGNALKTYMESYNYHLPDAATHCTIANFALDNDNFELAGKAIKSAFAKESADAESILASLFKRVWELIKTGFVNIDIIQATLKMFDNIGNVLEDYDVAKNELQLLKKYYAGTDKLSFIPGMGYGITA